MSAPQVVPTRVTIARHFKFCAGHRLYRPEWSDERNREVFGLCSNPAGHGHNYELEVSVTGPVDPTTGMVMNLRSLKHVVESEVLIDVDHKNLNVDVPWLAGIVPTTEAFGSAIFGRIAHALAKAAPGVTLTRLVLHETANNRVTIEP